MLIIFTRIWQNYQVYNQIQMEHTRFKPNKIQLNLANGHIKQIYHSNSTNLSDLSQNKTQVIQIRFWSKKTHLISANAHTLTNLLKFKI